MGVVSLFKKSLRLTEVLTIHGPQLTLAGPYRPPSLSTVVRSALSQNILFLLLVFSLNYDALFAQGSPCILNSYLRNRFVFVFARIL